jgi:hypothetical protein
MPGMADDRDVTLAVEVVGELLKDAETIYDTQRMAAKYVAFHDEMLNETLDANGGYTTHNHVDIFRPPTHLIALQDRNVSFPQATSTDYVSPHLLSAGYICEWQEGVSVSGEIFTRERVPPGSIVKLGDNTVLDGIGMYGEANFTKTSLCYYTQIGGIPTSGHYMPTALMDDLGAFRDWSGLSNVQPTQEYEIVTTNGHFVHSSGAANLRDFLEAGSDDWMNIKRIEYIAADSTMAERLAANARHPNGYYNVFTRRDRGWWMFDGLESYTVTVMPQGLTGSWAGDAGRRDVVSTGSWEGQGPESFFIAPWAYSMYWGGCDTSRLEEWLDDYGKTFYRVEGYSGYVQDLNYRIDLMR